MPGRNGFGLRHKKVSKMSEVRIPKYTENRLLVTPMGQVIDYWHSLIGSLNASSTGKRAAIFYMDTAGVFQHPDISTAGNKYAGNSTPDPDFDKAGHGHLCAGVGSAMNNQFGVKGVAPDSLPIPRKCMRDDNRGTYNEIANEIDKAVDTFEKHLKGKYIPIMSMSFGGAGTSSVMQKALGRAEAAGFILVASAGNNGGQVLNPAAYDNVIAVPAFNQNDQIADWSARGPEIDIAAYGVNILTTNNNQGYSLANGTSFSGPMIAGAVALMVDKHFKEFSQAGGKANELARQHLKGYARDILEPGRDDFSGAGIVSVQKILQNTPIFDQNPPEDDEPAPPVEKPRRRILVPIDQEFTMVWGTQFYPGDFGLQNLTTAAMSGRRVLHVNNIVASTEETMPYHKLYDKVLKEVIKFFHNRGLILFPDSDSWDAAKYTRQFADLIIDNEIKTFKIHELKAKDEQGRLILH